jgi:hypothetical protein
MIKYWYYLAEANATLKLQPNKIRKFTISGIVLSESESGLFPLDTAIADARKKISGFNLNRIQIINQFEIQGSIASQFKGICEFSEENE